jgi:hypothetical protein
MEVRRLATTACRRRPRRPTCETATAPGRSSSTIDLRRTDRSRQRGRPIPGAVPSAASGTPLGASSRRSDQNPLSLNRAVARRTSRTDRGGTGSVPITRPNGARSWRWLGPCSTSVDWNRGLKPGRWRGLDVKTGSAGRDAALFRPSAVAVGAIPFSVRRIPLCSTVYVDSPPAPTVSRRDDQLVAEGSARRRQRGAPPIDSIHGK